MSKILAVMILFNVLMGVAFAYSNFSLWDKLNMWVDMGYGKAIWSPMVIKADSGMLFWGEIPNYSFWLFWVAMAGNMFFAILFAVLILRSKGKTS